MLNQAFNFPDFYCVKEKFHWVLKRVQFRPTSSSVLQPLVELHLRSHRIQPVKLEPVVRNFESKTAAGDSSKTESQCCACRMQ